MKKIKAINEKTGEERIFISAQEMADFLGTSNARIRYLLEGRRVSNGKGKMYQIRSIEGWKAQMLEFEPTPIPSHCWRCDCGATISLTRKDCPLCGSIKK